jgi:hypothetical protein
VPGCLVDIFCVSEIDSTSTNSSMSSISITCLKALRACIIDHPPCKRVRSCAHARQLAFDHTQKRNHATTALHLLQLSYTLNVSSASARRRNSQPLPPAPRTPQPCAVPPLANPLGAPLSICRRKVFIFPYFSFWLHFPLLWSVTAAHFVSPAVFISFFHSRPCSTRALLSNTNAATAAAPMIVRLLALVLI